MHPEERANAVKCMLGDGTYGVGMGLAAVMTVLPLLFKALGAGAIEIGLLSSVTSAGWVLAQPVGLFVIGRRPRNKRFLLNWGVPFWVPTFLVMGAATYFVSGAHPRLCRLILLMALAAWVCGDGMAVPLWNDWLSRLYSRDSRGRAMGMMAAAWAIGNGLAALAAGRVAEAVRFPLSYAVLFLAASVLFVGGLAFYWMVREPEELLTPYAPLRARDLFGSFVASLSEANFRNYLIGRALLAAGGGATAFYAVHFQSAQGGGVTAGTVITLGVLLALPQGVASYPLGRLGDSAGHKKGVILGAFAQAAAILLAFLGTGPVACALCFASLGVSFASGWVSHTNMLFETCPHDNRPAHITLSNVLLSPFVVLAPLATGWLMESAGRRAGIGLTLVPTALGVIWLALAVREPRDGAPAARMPGPQ